jgi:hypothetical protein
MLYPGSLLRKYRGDGGSVKNGKKSSPGAGARVPIQVDIGFGDAVTPGSIEIEYPTLLGTLAPNLKAYPRETSAGWHSNDYSRQGGILGEEGVSAASDLEFLRKIQRLLKINLPKRQARVFTA